MECTVTQQEQGTQVKLSGQFTFADNAQFKRILDLARQGQAQALELDFSAIDFIDSAGLGMLLLLRDECLSKNIPLSIRAIRGQVEKIFMISKFDQLFTLQA